ncbi:hypothetical protein [Paracoccus sp. ME4]|uniref:hypothetical protein n=1 Tax=Paracoccus sp. ME4 TaxID=3138066 RepID=UPI00398B4CC9
MTCEHCGRATGDPRSASNVEREIVLRIPERHFWLMRKTFHEMELKLGMHGLGELANTLKPYGKNFDQEFDVFRYFDDGAMAMASIGVTWGYRGVVLIGTMDARGRCPVHIDFTGEPGSRPRRMRMSDCATPEAADRFKAWFEDLQDRLAPPSGEAVGPDA